MNSLNQRVGAGRIKKRASLYVFQRFPAELMEIRRFVKQLKKDFYVTQKYLKAPVHLVQASEIWQRLQASGEKLEALDHKDRTVVGN